MHINSNFTQKVVINSKNLVWDQSPVPGVERKYLDRIGGELAKATSIVNYAPNSNFTQHAHAEGEEILVLDGTFSDENGDYPAGTEHPCEFRILPRAIMMAILGGKSEANSKSRIYG